MKYILAIHIISIVGWFAGLFYLPRLFVYHSMTNNQQVHQQFCIMERKLYYYIMNPAFALTIGTGMLLLQKVLMYYSTFPNWLLVKLPLAMILVFYHFTCGYFLKLFREKRNKLSDKFFRLFNEIPTVLLISIVILAIVKPF
ncbi:MAG: TIGR00701 family protein [Thiotrichales bacterium]|nr:MAG: TIGR00701 family protein [Thiotrichales bacterium]